MGLPTLPSVDAGRVVVFVLTPIVTHNCGRRISGPSIVRRPKGSCSVGTQSSGGGVLSTNLTLPASWPRRSHTNVDISVRSSRLHHSFLLVVGPRRRNYPVLLGVLDTRTLIDSYTTMSQWGFISASGRTHPLPRYPGPPYCRFPSRTGQRGHRCITGVPRDLFI